MSRTILRRDTEGGLEAVVRPRIVGALQRERNQLEMLDAWLDRQAGKGSRREAALAVRSAVAGAMEASVSRNPTEAAAVRPTAVAIVDDSALEPKAKREAIGLLQSRLASFDLERSDPIVVELRWGLHERLPPNLDYRTKERARDIFGSVLFHTLGILRSRDNVGSSSMAGTDYLFELSTSNLPVEDDLNGDYYGFLETTRLRPRRTENDFDDVGTATSTPLRMPAPKTMADPYGHIDEIRVKTRDIR